MASTRRGFASTFRCEAFQSSVPFIRRRDLCVRASFCALDPSIHLQITARCEHVGVASSQYALIVNPARQASRAHAHRVERKGKHGVDRDRLDSAPGDCPVGSPNDMELRVLGPTLEGSSAVSGYS